MAVAGAAGSGATTGGAAVAAGVGAVRPFSMGSAVAARSPSCAVAASAAWDAACVGGADVGGTAATRGADEVAIIPAPLNCRIRSMPTSEINSSVAIAVAKRRRLRPMIGARWACLGTGSVKERGSAGAGACLSSETVHCNEANAR